MGSATQATRFKPVEMFLNDECVTTTDAPSDDGIESFESPAELKAFKASKENKVTFRNLLLLLPFVLSAILPISSRDVLNLAFTISVVVQNFQDQLRDHPDFSSEDH